ncbi:hypothetical protein JS44_14345 [Anoxybacillus flavithermus]|uniref:Uncharacterized protein n=1 Tax=Anoxybacillus flavithermus TaxID=33934 RepID=A0A094LBG4_9BACL|nr:hypothetical protein JS44_14345 [Anoxybacillus flavithermus]
MKKYRDHLNSISEPKPAIVQLWLDVEALSRYVKSGLILKDLMTNGVSLFIIAVNTVEKCDVSFT